MKRTSTPNRMTVPPKDVYTYYTQALSMLKKSHPHYEEVREHLIAQIQDELNTQYNSSTD